MARLVIAMDLCHPEEDYYPEFGEKSKQDDALGEVG
jgi:hypothetical protein